MEVIYRDGKKGLSLAEILRNGYTIFMSLFYVLLITVSLLEPIYEEFWMNVYTWLIWFPTIVFYLTPSFQNFFLNHENFNKSKYTLRLIWSIILYPLVLFPFIGTFALAFFAGLSIKRIRKSTYKEIENYRELEDKITDLGVSNNLEKDKKILLKDVKNRKSIEEIEKKFDKLMDRQKNQFNEKIDSFVDQYGKGNPDQIEKLKKLINREENIDLNYQNVKEMVHSTCRERQKQEFNSKLNSYETESYDDILEAFVEEFGMGNEQTLAFLDNYTGREEVKSDVEDKFEEMRNERELEQFKQELNSSQGAKNLLGEIEDNHIDWKDIQQMNGFDFEEVVADLFNAKGYDAKVTSGSGDQGADVVADKDFEKVVIQAKRYKGKVSNSAVQEVVASMKHYNADRGLVITNSQFTSSARELASSNDIELWNGGKLKEQIEAYLNKNSI